MLEVFDKDSNEQTVRCERISSLCLVGEKLTHEMIENINAHERARALPPIRFPLAIIWLYRTQFTNLYTSQRYLIVHDDNNYFCNYLDAIYRFH